MWKDLTMSQRADMMDLYLSKGITSLDDMRSLYDSSISDTVQGTSFSDGGSIHIDPSKKGTFTAAAKKHGMGVQEFASRVLANKENYSPAMVKKANFARNASKWHGYGGNLYDGTTEDTQQMDIPYAGELPDVTVRPRRIANKAWDKVQERWVGDMPTYYAVNPETGKEEMLREIGNGKYSTYDDKHVFDVLGAEAAKKEREQWIKNGGNASDFDKVILGTLGLGLAPIALPEITAGVGTALTNPYVDAGLTSYFGAHGLNHAINEGVNGWGDAAMTALEVAPLGRLVKPIYEGVVQPGMRLFNSPLTGNWTKIGNKQYRLSPSSLGANGSPIESRATPSWVEKLPLDESRYYRQVRPDALDSYRANGVISQFNKYGINPTRYEVPMFTKGKPSLYRGETKKYGDVWVVSKPEANLEWESVKGAAVSPKYNGEFNSAPVSEFEFYQYDPAKGYIKLDEGLNLPNGINFSRTPHIDYLKGLSEQQQIEYLTQNGLNDQWLWALKNNPDHLESALSKAPIPNTPQITAENAASITPTEGSTIASGYSINLQEALDNPAFDFTPTGVSRTWWDIMSRKKPDLALSRWEKLGKDLDVKNPIYTDRTGAEDAKNIFNSDWYQKRLADRVSNPEEVTSTFNTRIDKTPLLIQDPGTGFGMEAAGKNISKVERGIGIDGKEKVIVDNKILLHPDMVEKMGDYKYFPENYLDDVVKHEELHASSGTGLALPAEVRTNNYEYHMTPKYSRESNPSMYDYMSVDDEQRVRLLKFAELAETKFGGDYNKAFDYVNDHYYTWAKDGISHDVMDLVTNFNKEDVVKSASNILGWLAPILTGATLYGKQE